MKKKTITVKLDGRSGVVGGAGCSLLTMELSVGLTVTVVLSWRDCSGISHDRVEMIIFVGLCAILADGW